MFAAGRSGIADKKPAFQPRVCVQTIQNVPTALPYFVKFQGIGAIIPAKLRLVWYKKHSFWIIPSVWKTRSRINK